MGTQSYVGPGLSGTEEKFGARWGVGDSPGLKLSCGRLPNTPVSPSATARHRASCPSTTKEASRLFFAESLFTAKHVDVVISVTADNKHRAVESKGGGASISKKI